MFVKNNKLKSPELYEKANDPSVVDVLLCMLYR